jgi:hypothetical protein
MASGPAQQAREALGGRLRDIRLEAGLKRPRPRQARRVALHQDQQTRTRDTAADPRGHKQMVPAMRCRESGRRTAGDRTQH